MQTNNCNRKSYCHVDINANIKLKLLLEFMINTLFTFLEIRIPIN